MGWLSRVAERSRAMLDKMSFVHPLITIVGSPHLLDKNGCVLAYLGMYRCHTFQEHLVIIGDT